MIKISNTILAQNSGLICIIKVSMVTLNIGTCIQKCLKHPLMIHLSKCEKLLGLFGLQVEIYTELLDSYFHKDFNLYSKKWRTLGVMHFHKVQI